MQNNFTFTPEQISHRLAERGLVRGFNVITYKHAAKWCETIETLYYVDFDGVTVYAAEPRKYSQTFKGKNWQVVQGLPEGADFIGNYYRPEQNA